MHIAKLILSGIVASMISTTAAVAADALDDSALADVRGGQSTNVATQTVTATAANSLSAGTVESGAVDFSTNAFQNFNGIGNVVVNTGNNNIIQGTLQVYMVSSPNP